MHASQYYRFGGLKSSNSVGDPHVERKITEVAAASNTYGLSPWFNKVLQKRINRGVQKYKHHGSNSHLEISEQMRCKILS